MENKERYHNATSIVGLKGFKPNRFYPLKYVGVAPNFKNYAHSFKKFLLKDRVPLNGLEPLTPTTKNTEWCSTN